MFANKLQPKRPQWSLKTSFWVAVAVVTLVSLTVLLVLKKSIWVELHILTVTLSLFMFAYLFLVLYYGVRFDRNEQFTLSWPVSKFETWWNASSQFGTGGTFTEGGAEAGPLGIIIGFLLDLLISVVIAFVIALVLWLSFSFAVTAIVIVSIPLFFLFRRSIRFVVAKGRSCHRNLGRSIIFAMRATATNIAWFYAILVTAEYIARFKGA